MSSEKFSIRLPIIFGRAPRFIKTAAAVCICTFSIGFVGFLLNVYHKWVQEGAAYRYWEARLFEQGFAPTIGFALKLADVKIVVGMRINPQKIYTTLKPLAVFFEQASENADHNEEESAEESPQEIAEESVEGAEELEDLGGAESGTEQAPENSSGLGLFFDTIAAAWNGSFIQFDAAVWLSESALKSIVKKEKQGTKLEEVFRNFVLARIENERVRTRAVTYLSSVFLGLRIPEGGKQFDAGGALHQGVLQFDRYLLQEMLGDFCTGQDALFNCLPNYPQSDLLGETGAEKNTSHPLTSSVLSFAWLPSLLHTWLNRDTANYTSQLNFYWKRNGNMLYFSNVSAALKQTEESQFAFFDDYRFRRAAKFEATQQSTLNKWLASYVAPMLIGAVDNWSALSEMFRFGFSFSGALRFAKIQNSLLDAVTFLQNDSTHLGEVMQSESYEFFQSPQGLEKLQQFEESISRLTELCGSLSFQLRLREFGRLFSGGSKFDVYALALQLRHPNFMALEDGSEATLLDQFLRFPFFYGIFEKILVEDLSFEAVSDELLNVDLELSLKKVVPQGRM